MDHTDPVQYHPGRVYSLDLRNAIDETMSTIAFRPIARSIFWSSTPRLVLTVLWLWPLLPHPAVSQGLKHGPHSEVGLDPIRTDVSLRVSHSLSFVMEDDFYCLFKGRCSFVRSFRVCLVFAWYRWIFWHVSLLWSQDILSVQKFQRWQNWTDALMVWADVSQL